MSAQITTQPADVINAVVGSTVTFHVGIGIVAGGSINAQWKRVYQGQGLKLPSGGIYSGTNSTTLTIENVSSVAAGLYYCSVNGTDSNSAALTVQGSNAGTGTGGGNGGILIGGGQTGGSGGVAVGGAGINSGLSISAYSSKLGGSCLAPYFHPSLLNRLIPQDGAQFSKGDHGEDIFNLPYKIARIGNWLGLIPRKGSALSDFSTMYLWDPQRTGSTKGPMASVNLIYKGLADGTIPDAIVTDDTTIASVSVQADNGGSLEFSYYAPRSVYRYIVQGDPKGIPKYTSVRNSANRPIRIYRSYYKSGTDDGESGDSFYQPLYVNQSEINVSTRSEQMGAYWLCDDEAVKSLVNPYSAS